MGVTVRWGYDGVGVTVGWGGVGLWWGGGYGEVGLRWGGDGVSSSPVAVSEDAGGLAVGLPVPRSEGTTLPPLVGSRYVHRVLLGGNPSIMRFQCMWRLFLQNPATLSAKPTGSVLPLKKTNSDQ